MGHLRKSILIFLLLSCSADPQAELNRRLPSYYIYQGKRLLPLGGWGQVLTIPPVRLRDPVLVPWGDTFFLETEAGVGFIAVQDEVLTFREFEPKIRQLKKTWKWDQLFIFAQLEKPGLYRWSPFGAPEQVLIPTHLAEPEKAKLARVEWVKSEWLLQWADPLNRWTLFNARVGLERQLTQAEVNRMLEQVASRSASELSEEYRPYLPTSFTLVVYDERLEVSPTTYRQGNGPAHYALRHQNEIWVLDSTGWVRGSGGEAKIPLGSGTRTVGLGALPSGLALVWEKKSTGNLGHWGLVHVPWQFLKNRGIVER